VLALSSPVRVPLENSKMGSQADFPTQIKNLPCRADIQGDGETIHCQSSRDQGDG